MNVSFRFSLFAVALTAAGVASAQPIDSFKIGASPAAGEYSLGNVLGQNPAIVGWSGAWRDGFQGDRFQVVNTGLSYSTVPVAGGSVETLADQSGRTGRNLASPISDATTRTLYLSFMMQATDAVAEPQITYAAFETHNANGLGDGDRQLQIGVGENLDDVAQSPNYFVSLFNSNAGNFAADLGPNDGLVNFFVAKFEFSSVNNADTFSLYWNPTDLAVEANNTPDFTATGFNMSLNSTSFARFGAAGTVVFDELRTGNTFTSVTSPVAAFLPGDSNGNFIVEMVDFNPIRDNWLETNASFGMTLDRGDGDLNLDGTVDLRDFREWKTAFNPSPAVAAQALASLGGAAVPEPSTFVLAGLGLLVAGGLTRCRNSR